MTNAKTALFLGLCLLGLAASGCRGPHSANDAEGTLEFVVRSIEDVGSAVPQGSFEVRGIDNDEHARVGIGSSTARTVRLRLPAGAYSVAWRPSPQPRGSRARLTPRLEAAPQPSQIVQVSPEYSATVDVFVAAQSAPGALARAPGRGL